jgi:hypothetical protein
MKWYHLWLAASIIASIGGIVAFYFLFLRDLNIYWLILSPIIIALYQAPAVLLFNTYKKQRRKAQETDSETS